MTYVNQFAFRFLALFLTTIDENTKTYKKTRKSRKKQEACLSFHNQNGIKSLHEITIPEHDTKSAKKTVLNPKY